MRFLVAFLSALFVLPVLAQPITIHKVAFGGAPAYDSAALMRASGIHPGVSSGEEIRAGAQRLSDTGLFSNVQFKFDGETVTYNLTVAPHMLKARFDNFVWWTPAELEQNLHALVPLFTGDAPEHGSLTTSISDALTKMLAGKSVTATVSCLPESAGEGQPMSVMTCRIVTPLVKISSIKVQGASGELAEKLDPVLQAATNQVYSAATSQDYFATAISNVAFENGYMEERLTDFKLGPPVVQGESVNVDAVATVEPGLQYHVSVVAWAGSPVLSKDAFTKLNPLKPGSIASKQELTRGLQALGSYYYRNGYMNAKLHADPVFDRAHATVIYTITVDPGEQFHLADVNFRKLSPEQYAAVQKAWTMRPGDLYDRTYVTSFLVRNRETLGGVLANYAANYKETADHDAHTVELEVSFMPLSGGH
jgi:outer membrane protein insertion porin family